GGGGGRGWPWGTGAYLRSGGGGGGAPLRCGRTDHLGRVGRATEPPFGAPSGRGARGGCNRQGDGGTRLAEPFGEPGRVGEEHAVVAVDLHDHGARHRRGQLALPLRCDDAVVAG